MDVIDQYPEEVTYVIELYALIWQNNTQAYVDKLSITQRQQYHEQHSLPVMQGLKTWCKNRQCEPLFEGNSALGGAISYFLKHFEGLTAFCRIPGAQIDNNLVEMTIKLIARGRKNSYFFKTLAGAKVGDVATSLIATCELGGINPFEYLVALQQNRWEVSRYPQDWLPWTYQQTLSEK